MLICVKLRCAPAHSTRLLGVQLAVRAAQYVIDGPKGYFEL
jgi:hypothetical protein